MNCNLIVKSRKWQAKWIWLKNIPSSQKNIYGLFRKEIKLEKTLKSTIFISADSRYQLIIDGNPIGWGPPQSQPYRQYYDEYQIELSPGIHSIAIIVYTLGESVAGLLFEMTDLDGHCIAATNTDWCSLYCQAWKQDTYYFRMHKLNPYQEIFDSTAFPYGWEKTGFNDSLWLESIIVRGLFATELNNVTSWPRLVPRDIPYLKQTAVYPVKVEKVEESLWLEARSRNDMSIALSTPGKVLEFATVENSGSLTKKDEETVVRCSTNHLDGVFDGVYEPVILLDFGRVINAFPEITIDAPAGTKVTFGYSERLIDGHFNNSIESGFADAVILKGGEQTWKPAFWRSFRYLKLRLNCCYENAAIKQLQAIKIDYPFVECGDFISDDKDLSQVFAISRNTLKLCSIDCLTDTPWREAGQWLGDVSAVTVPAVFACFGDTKLASKFFQQSGDNQMPPGFLSNMSNSLPGPWNINIPDYSLWWLMALWEHYMYTGNENWLINYYPECLKIIKAHMPYINDRGLIENMPYWILIDWAAIDLRGESAAYNAIFAGALQVLIRISDFMGDHRSKERYKLVLDKLQSEYQKVFFNTRKGIIVDAVIDGKCSEKYSEHANFSAILWGLCDKKASKSIIAEFYEKDFGNTMHAYVEAQPFYMVVILKALAKAGRMDLALKLIRDRWGRRMIDRGVSSCFEEWGENGSWRTGEYRGFMRSNSHAWSACPAEFLIKNMIGIEIIEPGGTKVRLNPAITEFDYKATYPLVNGNITVDCKNTKIEVSVSGDINIDMPEATLNQEKKE